MYLLVFIFEECNEQNSEISVQNQIILPKWMSGSSNVGTMERILQRIFEAVEQTLNCKLGVLLSALSELNFYCDWYISYSKFYLSHMAFQDAFENCNHKLALNNSCLMTLLDR